MSEFILPIDYLLQICNETVGGRYAWPGTAGASLISDKTYSCKTIKHLFLLDEHAQHRIVHQWNQRDMDALQQIHQLYHNPLYDYALRLTGLADDAKDLVNDAFLKVWQSKHRFRSFPQIAPYLWRTTHTLFLDHQRRKGIKRKVFDRLQRQQPSSDDISDYIIRAEMYKNLRAQLPHLPPMARLIFILTFQGCTLEEIAQKTKTTKQNVQNHWRKASTKLRTLLAEKDLL